MIVILKEKSLNGLESYLSCEKVFKNLDMIGFTELF